LRDAIARYRPEPAEAYNLWNIPNVSLFNISTADGRKWLIDTLESLKGRGVIVKPLGRALHARAG
jgi:hypothetical protein